MTSKYTTPTIFLVFDVVETARLDFAAVPLLTLRSTVILEKVIQKCFFLLLKLPHLTQ